ncbi:structural protein [Rhodococcus phage E3]|uniref:structural protein n=1 Tax=Rhodococcus phage E3 TaxID=1007869 RepID=UPI0002C6BB34|nr:structural protein [Rhodococcus phage E3]AEQ21013.1 structural protein [Rhodococcus phage E3]
MAIYYVKNLTDKTITLSFDEDVQLLQLEPKDKPGDRTSISDAVASQPGFQRLWDGGKIAVYATNAYTTPITILSPQAVGVATGLAGASAATPAPTAGGGAALPATPKGYLDITVNGAPAKIAYY